LPLPLRVVNVARRTVHPTALLLITIASLQLLRDMTTHRNAPHDAAADADAAATQDCDDERDDEGTLCEPALQRQRGARRPRMRCGARASSAPFIAHAVAIACVHAARFLARPSPKAVRAGAYRRLAAARSSGSATALL
tara:strand:- start:384 stop:800 length:417 start_codon:yes stop_codon:yes gene_type:complete